MTLRYLFPVVAWLAASASLFQQGIEKEFVATALTQTADPAPDCTQLT
jgi:hypothetical protein